MKLKHMQEQIKDIIKKQNKIKNGGDVDYTAPTKGNVYQLKVLLKRSRPPVWRRVLVNDDLTLHQLHTIIQAVMGWTDTHLYGFQMGDVFFEVEDEESFGKPVYFEIHDSREVLLGNVLTIEGQKFNYTYDFGDNWEHSIVLEKIDGEKTIDRPKCLKGKRACPPEDCGGIHRYQYLLERLNEPGADDEEVQSFREFCENHDPEYFDLDETNDILRELELD
ncbi:plasmid pRiA4b ORF-3 family protein [Bacillus sp. SCS-153A]|uniref:plasmid pRiA4b ORF-3 family protein n=1 Tax=Rossellomorea sedimentorum TaxID=3115294 RepID=UPI003906C8FA